MTSTGILTQPSGSPLNQGPLFRAASGVLLLLFAVIYSGAFELFLSFSPLLLYGTYLVIIMCVVGCLLFDWQITRNLQSVAPYLIWALSYFMWGMIAASSYAVVTSEGVKMGIKNALIIGSLAIMLDRRTLKPFANLVQIVSIASIGLCFWEVAHPEVIELIAKTRHEGATAYDVLRPAALWSNPDEAASSFLFALLLGRWAGRHLALLGRISAVIGIYLGASRTGAYLLAICGLVYAAFWLRTVRIDSARLAVLVGSFLIVGTVGMVAVIQLGFDPSEHRQFARILDFTEAKASAAGGSRLDIAGEAAETILAGPWQGYGLFTFQLYALEGVREVLATPAHNIYLTVWGETGPLIALAYVFVLGMGLRQVFRAWLLPADRIPILLMWFCYLVVGLTWHNQFTSFAGMIFIGLLYHLPSILRLPPDSSVQAREVSVDSEDSRAFANAPTAEFHRQESILLQGSQSPG